MEAGEVDHLPYPFFFCRRRHRSRRVLFGFLEVFVLPTHRLDREEDGVGSGEKGFGAVLFLEIGLGYLHLVMPRKRSRFFALREEARTRKPASSSSLMRHPPT